MLKTFFLLLISFPLFAQKSEDWDVYLAEYEKGAGSTLINMAAKQAAPNKDLPFIVITGVTFKGCTNDGFPSKQQFNELYRIADSVKSIIINTTRFLAVGTFTYQCQRLDYYYVNDTSSIRLKLNTLYNGAFPSYLPYINIKEDKSWEGYLTFLYPNEETMEYMSNQKIVSKLQEAGDNLEKARKVDHWLYFKSDSDRNCILPYLEKAKFKVELKEKIKDFAYPFKLHISRTDKIDINSITEVTRKLREKVKSCNGDYNGWETIVVK